MDDNFPEVFFPIEVYNTIIVSKIGRKCSSASSRSIYFMVKCLKSQKALPEQLPVNLTSLVWQC